MIRGSTTCTDATAKEEGGQPPEIFHRGAPHDAVMAAHSLLENGIGQKTAECAAGAVWREAG